MYLWWRGIIYSGSVFFIYYFFLLYIHGIPYGIPYGVPLWCIHGIPLWYTLWYIHGIPHGIPCFGQTYGECCVKFLLPQKFALYVKICYNRSGSKDKICMQVVNHKVNPSG